MSNNKKSSLISILFQLALVVALIGGLAYLAKRFLGIDLDTVKKKVDDFTSGAPDANEMKE